MIIHLLILDTITVFNQSSFMNYPLFYLFRLVIFLNLKLQQTANPFDILHIPQILPERNRQDLLSLCQSSHVHQVKSFSRSQSNQWGHVFDIVSIKLLQWNHDNISLSQVISIIMSLMSNRSSISPYQLSHLNHLTSVKSYISLHVMSLSMSIISISAHHQVKYIYVNQAKSISPFSIISISPCQPNHVNSCQWFYQSCQTRHSISHIN